MDVFHLPFSPLSQATFGFPANMNSNSLMYFSFSFFFLFLFSSFAQIPTVSVRTTQSLSSNIHHHSIHLVSRIDRSPPSRPNSNICHAPSVRIHVYAHGVVSGHDVLRICCVGIPIKTTMLLRSQLVSWSSKQLRRRPHFHINESTSATSCSSTMRAMFRLPFLLACAVCLLSAILSAQSQSERKPGSPSKASRAIWAVVNEVVAASGPDNSTRTTSWMMTAKHKSGHNAVVGVQRIQRDAYHFAYTT